MTGKKVKLRLAFLTLLFLSLILIVFLIIKSLEENVVYFKSPSEIKSLYEKLNKNFYFSSMNFLYILLNTCQRVNYYQPAIT